MDTPIPVDLGRIAQDLQIRRVQVESVVQLLDEGNTVPFITRYRKERTGNLNEVAIREIQNRVKRLRELAERKETILKAIEAQGKLSDELRDAIKGAENPKRLEDLYLPYKPKKRTKASDAREKGLEPLALRIWNRDETLANLKDAAAEFVSAEKGLDTPELVLEGVGHILSESINELAIVREAVRRAVWRAGKVVTTKGDNLPEGQGLEYRDYFNYSEPIGLIPPHRVLAINRGDKEGPLKVKLEVPRQDLERAILGQLPLEGHPHAEAFHNAAIDALDRLLLPSLEREVRRDLTEMAERHAVDVFARNLRSLLLQPPITKQVVLAIDPGFRTGCKVAVLDHNGTMLEQTVIHPHQPQNRRYEAKQAIKELVLKHHVGVVAIGNGTACRETEELVAEVIAEGTLFHTDPEAAARALAQPEPPPPVPVAHQPKHAEPTTTMHEDHPEHAEPTTHEAAHQPEHAEPTTTTHEDHAEPQAHAASEPEHAAEHHGDPGENHAAPAESHHEPVEAMPPIAGGAPDEGEGEEHQAPPASSASEEPAASAAQAEVLESPHTAENRNPVHEPEPAPHEPAAEPAAEHQPVAPHETPAAPPAHEAHAPEGSTPAEPAATEHAPAAPSAEVKPAPSPATDFTRPPKAPKHERSEKKDGPPKPPKIKTPPPPPRPHAADPILAQLSYVIVNEAGASVYSASTVGREEFPDLDATTRGTISIGRRLQDPLSELVKIEPANIGVGLYQHDVNAKQLKDTLESVIESCVNFVGVDLNTASIPLLRHVSGLNALTARRLVEHRAANGPFADRSAIQAVEGIGPATFTQAAGFLKVAEATNPLDRTWIHPESYETATKVLEKLGFTTEILGKKDELPALHEKLNAADFPELAKELNIGEPTLRDIFDALARPERDPREDLPKPIFKKGVLKIEDLAAGMELKGTVLNVVDFGAFVDIGLKDSGLVHISQLANRYIKSPHDVVSVGDVVSAWVMGVDGERKRVSLTMVQPGTERPKAERAPGGGGGQRRGGGGGGEGRPPGPGGGGDRRGGGAARPPRQGAAPGEGGPPPAPAEGGPPRLDRPARAPREGGPSGGRPPSGPGGPSSNDRFARFQPQRAQQGGRGGRSGGPNRPGGGPNRGPGAGPRPSEVGDPNAAPKPKPKPSAPTPLSKDVLTGSAPLRTFGQLKQLFEARTGEPNEGDAPTGSDPQSQGPPQTEPGADPQHSTPEDN